MKPLPDDFIGERHVEIVKREPANSANVEWCEFEEFPGPAPAGYRDDAFTICLMK